MTAQDLMRNGPRALAVSVFPGDYVGMPPYRYGSRETSWIRLYHSKKVSRLRREEEEEDHQREERV
jgi:hypothetical protein